jgi:nuclear pore complex protein Nup93
MGNFITWCIHAAGQQRDILLNSPFNDPTKRALAEQCVRIAKDIMVFVGLVKYKLPPRIYDMLAEHAQEGSF